MNVQKISKFVFVFAAFFVFSNSCFAYYYEQPIANTDIYPTGGFYSVYDEISEYPVDIVDTPIWLGFFIMSTSTAPYYLDQNDTQVGLFCWSDSGGGQWVQQQTAHMHLGDVTNNGDGAFHWIATTTGNALNGWSVCNQSYGMRATFYKLYEGRTRGNSEGHIALIVSADEISSDITSRIDTFTYSTTTGYANITGYWNDDPSETIFERLVFEQKTNMLPYNRYEFVNSTSTGFFNYSFFFYDPYEFGESSTTPIFSNFELTASLWSVDNTNYVFPYGGAIEELIVATSTIVSADEYDPNFFVIDTGREIALYPEYECSISNITGCIKNALIWAFYLPQQSLDNWNLLKSKLETKAPFGYFAVAKNSINQLSATSTSAFNVTIPKHIQDYFFTPVYTGIASILWFFFLFHFYKRLKHITI